MESFIPTTFISYIGVVLSALILNTRPVKIINLIGLLLLCTGIFCLYHGERPAGWAAIVTGFVVLTA